MVSRQREYQLRKRKAGLCKQCGKPAEKSTRKGVEFKTHCEDCSRKIRPYIREYARKDGKRTRRYPNARSYKEQNETDQSSGKS